MADVQRRLLALGFDTLPDGSGYYGPGTRAAIEAFQHARGLRVDGIFGPQTWAALVEAGLKLGDRLLYQRQPMLRGDDVADLQRRLSALGFDTGRVDGIFGPQTARAVAELQRNVGLPPDGICGRRTLLELFRVMPRRGDYELVTTVRDRERLRMSPRTLRGRTIAVGEEGGLDALVSSLCRRVSSLGAEVVPIWHPDGSRQAVVANAAGADAYVGLRLALDDLRCQASFYSGYQYESAGGRRLADLVVLHLSPILGTALHTAGMSVPVLRETSMPAVVCEMGPPAAVVRGMAALAGALAGALAAWAADPVDESIG